MGVPRSEATGQVTPEMWNLMQDPIQVAPRRAGGIVRSRRDLPARAGDGDLPRRRAGAGGAHVERPAEPRRHAVRVQRGRHDRHRRGRQPACRSRSRSRSRASPTRRPACSRPAARCTGERNGPLGTMWDPVYINQGIAIHGANNVPLEPASHGCIRVSRYLGPIVQDLIDKGDAVLIWDGKKEPEQQTAEGPPDDLGLGRPVADHDDDVDHHDARPRWHRPRRAAPATTKAPGDHAPTTRPTTTARPRRRRPRTPTTVEPVDGL